MNNTVIQDLMSKLSSKMEDAADLTTLMSNVNAEVSDLRERLHEEMQNQGVKSLGDYGLLVSRRSKKYPAVTDSDVLFRYIVSNGMESDYTITRFDETKAKRDAVKNGWPGVAVEERDELVVKLERT